VIVATWLAPATASGTAPYDFSGDGRPQIVVGLPESGARNSGAVVLYPTTGERRRVTQSTGGVPDRAETGDGFGEAVASADFNADGYADLAIGAPGEQPEGLRRRRGAVTILPGSRAGVTTLGAQVFAARGRTPPGFSLAYGYSLVAGDLDRDRYGDLAVSMPGSNGVEDDTGAGAFGSGSVELLFGGPAGLSRLRSSVVERPYRLSDLFGERLALGDLDGDGYLDLLEGATGAFPAPFPGHESFCIGGPAGPQACRALRRRTDFGPTTMAAGDVTGDGYQDLVTGLDVWRDLEVPGEPYPVSAVEVWPGGPGGPRRRPVVITRNSRGVPGKETADTTTAAFGHSLLVAQLDHDRFADIIVTAPRDGSRPPFGSLTVIRGGPSGFAPRRSRRFTGDAAGLPRARRRLFGIAATAVGKDVVVYSGGVQERGVLTAIRAGRSGLAVARARHLQLPRMTEGEGRNYVPGLYFQGRAVSVGRVGSSD
jgi:hypothetical protein